jgi:hypothetical protein
MVDVLIYKILIKNVISLKIQKKKKKKKKKIEKKQIKV